MTTKTTYQLSPNLIKAAMCCVNKKEVRSYLRNLVIEHNFIIGTTGQMLFIAPYQGHNPQAVKIPFDIAKLISAEKTLFVEMEVDHENNTATAKLEGRTFNFELSKERSIHDFRKIYHTDFFEKENLGNHIGTLLPHYLETIAKVAKILKEDALIFSSSLDKKMTACHFKGNSAQLIFSNGTAEIVPVAYDIKR